MVSGFPCLRGAIEQVNRLNFDETIGLGDIECPQLFRNFHGILGEMDSVHTFKEMDRKGMLIKDRFSVLSIDFSTHYVMSHFPPLGSHTGNIIGKEEGNSKVTASLLKNKPKILFHGHSEAQGIGEIMGTTVVSVGSLLRGHYVIFETDSLAFELGNLTFS
ncbi:hypothetical protein IC007_1821 [Sulfuracidifex tepidarius]|uniref:Calcineurin-like phosphoesterase domain-containing protein n=1 Tax=Sulfuracidifex tepidarius TaxID=1294262 RepID=A0A510E488_9CREN|nr:hypothetical protein IC007_1821 [Sulfuracidifex tepidarius]